MNTKVLSLFGDELPVVAPTPRKRRAAKAGEEAPAPEPDNAADPLENWKAEKLYYGIGEVAALFGISASNVRFWTNEFKLKVRTTAKGDRLYGEAQILELRRIFQLVKIKGHKISAAKNLLKERKYSAADAADLRQSLLKLRNLLVQVSNHIS